MSAIRIETQVSGEVLYLPQLKPFIGKSVEITISELPNELPSQNGSQWKSPLAGTVIEYIEPFAPATSPEDWEANR
jgi:hypothetical protein